MAIDWALYAKAAGKWIATMAAKNKKKGIGCGCLAIVAIALCSITVFILIIAVLFSAEGYYYPLETHRYVSSGFGPRESFQAGDYVTRDYHYGTDFPAPEGTPIHAAKGGVVTIAGDSGGSAGLWIIIQHEDGNSTRYYHCNSIDVEAGDIVATFTKIGEVGNTGGSNGDHLHFEIRLEDGTAIDAADQLQEWPDDIASILSLYYFVPDTPELLKLKRH